MPIVPCSTRWSMDAGNTGMNTLSSRIWTVGGCRLLELRERHKAASLSTFPAISCYDRPRSTVVKLSCNRGGKTRSKKLTIGCDDKAGRPEVTRRPSVVSPSPRYKPQTTCNIMRMQQFCSISNRMTFIFICKNVRMLTLSYLDLQHSLGQPVYVYHFDNINYKSSWVLANFPYGKLALTNNAANLVLWLTPLPEWLR